MVIKPIKPLYQPYINVQVSKLTFKKLAKWHDNKDDPSEIISTQCAPRQTNHTLESELCKNANITYLF